MGTMIVSLILALAILAPVEANAWEGEVVDNTITGCVRPGGSVRRLQRGDEPKRPCGRKDELVRFSETPLGHHEDRPTKTHLEVRVVSWDVELGLDEELSPVTGVEIVCKFLSGTDLTIRINGKVVAYANTDTLGHNRYFVYQESVNDLEYEGGGFIIRASGIGSTTTAEDPLPCASEGFAEFFDPK